MPYNININQSKVNEHSSNINNSAKTLDGTSTLSNIDNESTITGISNAQEAFNLFSTISNELIQSLQAESLKINTMGKEFNCIDKQLALMVQLVNDKKYP